MKELISEIFDIVKDYRADENDSSVSMSEDRITSWINQFEETDREFLLTELKHILNQRYISKKNAEEALVKVLQKLTERFNYSSISELLQNCQFLDLQKPEKSQKVLLNFLDKIITDKCKLSLNDCGTVSKKVSVYIDDIFCTGTTFKNEIKAWCDLKFSPNITNLEAVKTNQTELCIIYFVIYQKNFNKKWKEFALDGYDAIVKNGIHRFYAIENDVSPNSKLDLAYPIELKEQTIEHYKMLINSEVDSYIQGRYSTPEEFFRPSNLPNVEEFFSSSTARIRFEQIILLKGIQILSNVNNPKQNFRALGCTLPSHRNFGFGNLCFTWRNIPNNSPLVFWYEAGGWFPLFVVKRGVQTKLIPNNGGLIELLKKIGIDTDTLNITGN